MRRPINRKTLTLAILATAFAAPIRGQRVLDLPMRASAGSDALATGPIAVFWNPGALGLPATRGEALIMDIRGPAATNLDGVGLAGVVRLDERTAISAGFQHVGIGDILETTTSPLPGEGATPLDVSENAFHFAALRMVGPGLGVGASVQYTRTADVAGGDDVVGLGAGFRYAPAGAFEPVLAAGLRFDDASTDWFAGAGVQRPVGRDGAWRVGGDYGIAGSGRYTGLSHRAAATGAWQDRFRVSAGIAAEPGVEGRTLSPALGASLRFNRYVLGVLREDLPNGIGATHTFRFNVVF